ncbi:hypothetical protein TNCV_5017281 [Trichonephila clavipes]|nr:hypothetical protein TNCV_5017281 [Trichonephila clavipes]
MANNQSVRRHLNAFTRGRIIVMWGRLFLRITTVIFISALLLFTRKGISHPTEKGDAFPRLEEGNVPINTSWFGLFWGIPRVLGESWTARRYPSADSRPIRKADCVSKKNPLQNTEVNRREI